MFNQLFRSLEMKESFEPAASLITGHLQAVQLMLADFLRTDSLITPPLREAVHSLPEENQFRLLSSPYLCELLMIAKDNPQENLRRQINQALVAEVRLINPDFAHPLHPRWTVDADIVLDSQVAEKFPALQTSCGIRLNYQSYAHNTGKPGIGGYSYAMALKHKERLETGKKIVNLVSPAARSLVDTFTTTIQLRLNVNRPNVVNSSTHTSIGLIRCDNFQSLHEDMPEIVDMLVHESIHQYLHLFEEQLEPFIDLAKTPADVLDVRNYPSPWSGNPLDLRSYTHAILVWYGLWHFWSQFIASGYECAELSKAEAHEKLREAAFGVVQSSSVLDNLGESRNYLNSEFMLWVNEIQTQIKNQAMAAAV